MHRSRLVSIVLPLLVAAAQPVAAQRALGIGDDASTLPVGSLRLSASVLWDRANERYDASGKLRSLGASASAASWNGLYDARLAAATPLVANLSGVPGFDASLGMLRVGRRDASSDGILALEVGVLSRLTVGARITVASHAIEPGVSLNPQRIEGTVGLNPAWINSAARDLNTALLTQFDSAVAQTGRRIVTCQATPTATGCAPFVANVAQAQSLVTNASAFAAALNQLYGGRTNAAGLPFVPVANGIAQQAITQRVLGYRDQFAAFGNNVIGTQGPAAAALFSPADMAMMLSDSLYGYLLRPVRTVHAYGIGDVSVHAKVRLFQTVGDDTASIRGFALRQSASATVRLSGGDAPAADEPFAPMTGTGGSGYAVQSLTDLFYGNRLSATVVVGIDQSQAQEFTMRVPSADAPAVGGVPFPLVPAPREVRLSRSPGARIDIAVTPRMALTPSIWLGARWEFSQQSADAWSWTPPAASLVPGGAAVASADVATWSAGTDWSAQQLTVGGTYSTVLAARDHRARTAFDVTYEHQETMTGSGWRVPHLTRDVVTVRWYRRLWGR